MTEEALLGRIIDNAAHGILCKKHKEGCIREIKTIIGIIEFEKEVVDNAGREHWKHTRLFEEQEADSEQERETLYKGGY